MNYIAWITLYGMLFWLSERVSVGTGIQHVFTVVFLLLYWIVFFRFHHKRTRAKIDYICLPRNKRVVEYLVYTPMLLMAVVNVVILIRENCLINTTVQILSVNAIALFDFGVMCLITIGCVIGEEVAFRNVLPLLLMKHFNAKMKTAAVVSSLVFAGMHVFNIFSGLRLEYVLLQILNAGTVGFCLAMIAILEQSIVPGVVIHSLINISSVHFNEWDAGVVRRNFGTFIILPTLYAIYGGYLYWKGKRGKRYETVY